MLIKFWIKYDIPSQELMIYKLPYNSFRRMDKHQTVRSHIQANKSLLNTSKSKAMFTFPKEDRFQNVRLNSSIFYEKQSMLNKRAPSFGYGDKSDIALKKQSPSPDKYTLTSDFQNSIKLGVTIGQSREDCKSISTFYQSNNPGPGQYNIRNDKQNIKNMTMSAKLKFPSLWAESTAPGPGTYEIQKIDFNGCCTTSKYSSKSGFKIHPKSPEKQNNARGMLGPGTYNINIPSIGKQLLAQNKSEKSFIFSKKNRQTMNESTLSPGPGAYQHYSIFGI